MPSFLPRRKNYRIQANTYFISCRLRIDDKKRMTSPIGNEILTQFKHDLNLITDSYRCILKKCDRPSIRI